MLSSTSFRYTFFEVNSFLIMKSLHECLYGFVFTKSLIISIYQFLQDAIKNVKQHTLLTEY